MTVFHGSSLVVQTPDTNHSKPFLDFGMGFYVTSFREQAERLALRKAGRSGTPQPAYVSVYELAEGVLGTFKVLRFPEASGAWLDFVCACRKGFDIYRQWDAVSGPVANDDVFKTVNKYFRGELSREQAVEQLRFQRQSDQVAFISNRCLRASLSFADAYQVLTGNAK